MCGTKKIEVAPVPTSSNNTTAIPAVILIVNLSLFIFDIDFVNRIEYKHSSQGQKEKTLKLSLSYTRIGTTFSTDIVMDSTEPICFY
jgi:hypothetical protein